MLPNSEMATHHNAMRSVPRLRKSSPTAVSWWPASAPAPFSTEACSAVFSEYIAPFDVLLHGPGHTLLDGSGLEENSHMGI